MKSILKIFIIFFFCLDATFAQGDKSKDICYIVKAYSDYQNNQNTSEHYEMGKIFHEGLAPVSKKSEIIAQLKSLKEISLNEKDFIKGYNLKLSPSCRNYFEAQEKITDDFYTTMGHRQQKKVSENEKTLTEARAKILYNYVVALNKIFKDKKEAIEINTVTFDRLDYTCINDQTLRKDLDDIFVSKKNLMEDILLKNFGVPSARELWALSDKLKVLSNGQITKEKLKLGLFVLYAVGGLTFASLSGEMTVGYLANLKIVKSLSKVLSVTLNTLGVYQGAKLGSSLAKKFTEKEIELENLGEIILSAHEFLNLKLNSPFEYQKPIFNMTQADSQFYDNFFNVIFYFRDRGDLDLSKVIKRCQVKKMFD